MEFFQGGVVAFILRILGTLVIGVAVALALYTVLNSPTRPGSRLGLRGLKRQRALASSEIWASVEPMVRWVGVRVSRFLSPELRVKIDTAISLAGDYMGLTSDEFLALSILGAVIGASAGSIVGSIVLGSAGFGILLGMLVGAVYLQQQVAAAGQERMKQASRGLPYMIDLMSLSMGAGLDFPGAIRQVVERASSPDDAMVEEFTLILQSINLGVTRRDALQELARRLPADSVIEFVNALIQAEERGNAVAEVLAVQAGVARMRRSVRAEEAAAKAGAAMMGPLVLVFIAILGLLLGPTVLTLTRGLS